MRRFGHHAVGVDQGTVPMFSAHEDGGDMWTATGPRLVRHAVRFDEPFLAQPTVHVSVGMWDMAVSANQRGDICAENVTSEGFDIVFRSWGDTQVARIRAEWLAIGPVLHEDDWDLR